MRNFLQNSVVLLFTVICLFVITNQSHASGRGRFVVLNTGGVVFVPAPVVVNQNPVLLNQNPVLLNQNPVLLNPGFGFFGINRSRVIVGGNRGRVIRR